MVEDLGLNILVPLLVFGILIFGAYKISDLAIQDVNRRRSSGEY